MPITEQLPPARIIRLGSLKIGEAVYHCAEAAPGESLSVEVISIPSLGSKRMAYASGNLISSESLTFKVYDTGVAIGDPGTAATLTFTTSESILNAAPTEKVFTLAGFIVSTAPDSVVADGNRVKAVTIVFQPAGTPAEAES